MSVLGFCVFVASQRFILFRLCCLLDYKRYMSEKIKKWKIWKRKLNKDIEGQRQLVSLPGWKFVQVEMHNYYRGTHNTRSKGNQWWNICWRSYNTVPQGKPSVYSWSHQCQRGEATHVFPYFHYTVKVVVPCWVQTRNNREWCFNFAYCGIASRWFNEANILIKTSKISGRFF